MLLAGAEADLGMGAPVYARHRAERTLFYQIIDEYYRAFKQPLMRRKLICRGIGAGVRGLPEVRAAAARLLTRPL